MESSQVDTCILQFKELGLLRFAENKEEDGTVFRGVTLTELGERRLMLLSTRRRKVNTLDGATPSAVQQRTGAAEYYSNNKLPDPIEQA